MFHLEEPGTLGPVSPSPSSPPSTGLALPTSSICPSPNRLRAFHYHYGLFQEMTLEDCWPSPTGRTASRLNGGYGLI